MVCYWLSGLCDCFLVVIISCCSLVTWLIFNANFLHQWPIMAQHFKDAEPRLVIGVCFCWHKSHRSPMIFLFEILLLGPRKLANWKIVWFLCHIERFCHTFNISLCRCINTVDIVLVWVAGLWFKSQSDSIIWSMISSARALD